MTYKKVAVDIKIHYNDQPSPRVDYNKSVQQQEINDNQKLGGNYVAGQVSVASRDHA